jgi:dihydroxyacid dehydratase/phosphogluconate dehydratase
VCRPAGRKEVGYCLGATDLHVSSEASVGRPLALVRNGAASAFFASKKRIDLLIDAASLVEWAPGRVTRPCADTPAFTISTVASATDGCDFDFLEL